MGKDPDSKGDLPKANGTPRLGAPVHEAIRSRYYSRRTEKAYWYRIRYFILHHGRRHPAKMGTAEVSAFLSFLATRREVAAATQNQALHALLFLQKQVPGRELPWLGGVVQARRAARLPAMLTEDEVARLLAQLDGTSWLMESLLYGAGAEADRVPDAARAGCWFRLPSNRGPRR